jgi:hypothetical protein
MNCGIVTRPDVVERLPHHLQNVSLELRKLVKK